MHFHSQPMDQNSGPQQSANGAEVDETFREHHCLCHNIHMKMSSGHSQRMQIVDTLV